MYTAAEYAEMLIIYGDCRRNAREDEREYAIRFPHPNYNVFLGLVYRARDTGSLVPTWQEIGVPPQEVRTPETEDAVLQFFDDDGRRSIFEIYIYREPINILEELNDQIYETLATVIPNMLRLARENLIKLARLFLQMKGGHFEHLL
jgi:hypothetical protein